MGYGTVSKPYAAAVSAMLLTTEAAVIDIKEENPVGGMPGMMQSNKISFYDDQSVDWSPFMFIGKSV